MIRLSKGTNIVSSHQREYPARFRMRPKIATNAHMSRATIKTISQCHMLKLDIGCASARRSVNRGPSRKGQDCSGNPPAEARNENEQRERWVKTNSLKAPPARIDD